MSGVDARVSEARVIFERLHDAGGSDVRTRELLESRDVISAYDVILLAHYIHSEVLFYVVHLCRNLVVCYRRRQFPLVLWARDAVYPRRNVRYDVKIPQLSRRDNHILARGDWGVVLPRALSAGVYVNSVNVTSRVRHVLAAVLQFGKNGVVASGDT